MNTIFLEIAKNNANNIESALLVMGKGMLGIFLALGIVFIFVAILNKFFPEKKTETPENEE